MGFLDTVTMCLKPRVANIFIVHVTKLVFLSLTNKFHRGIRKKELDELRNQCIPEKGYDVFEMYGCDWWKMCQTDYFVEQHLRESIP